LVLTLQWTMPATHPYSAKPIQIIEGQYLDQQKLMRLLRIVYGTSDGGQNNFRVEVRDWYIKACHGR